jgi:hypothetical protein
MSTKKVLCLLSACFCLFSVGSIAQSDLPSEHQEVIKSFEARLLDADMLLAKPELPPADTLTKTQNYTLPARTIQVDYLPPVIKPLAIKKENVGDKYNGFAKLGAGYPVSFYGEAVYNLDIGKQFDLGINARHHSARFKRVDNQQFSNNNFGLKGTYYFDEGYAITGKLGYTRDYLYYYGYNFDPAYKDTFFTKEDVQQIFSIFDAGVSFFNGEQTVGDINYAASADFYYMNDNYAARENGFDLRLQMTKWFGEKHPLNIKLRTDFNSFRDSATQNLNNFYLQPNFTFHHDYFRVKAGANLVSHDDKYSIFPDVEATVPILGSRLAAFLGAEGSLQKNTMRTFADYNPFIGTRANLEIKNTTYFDYFGGLKGSVSGFEYQGRVGYRQSEDLALYIPNYTGIKSTVVPYDFRVIYDDVNIFYISGSINAPIFKGFSVLGSATSNVYSPSKEAHAWQLPALTIQGEARYTTNDGKAKVKAGVFVENGVPYPTENGVKERLNGLLDISVGGEMQISKNFSVYLDIYNLANNKRRRWYNYPTYGLNALVGVIGRF